MIVAGFGFRASASVDSLLDAYTLASKTQSADSIATVKNKAESDAFQSLASALDLPAHSVGTEEANTQKTHTKSVYSQTTHGTGSVAEASALAAAGAGSRLIQTRVISGDRLATCALAQSATEGEDR